MCHTDYWSHILCIIFQAESWIVEKMTVASDESYRDPTNLQSKLQKHAAFQGELSSNKGRVDSVTEVHACTHRQVFQR